MTANNLYAAIASAPVSVSASDAAAAAAAVATVAKVSVQLQTGQRNLILAHITDRKSTRYKLYGSSKVQVESDREILRGLEKNCSRCRQGNYNRNNQNISNINIEDFHIY